MGGKKIWDFIPTIPGNVLLGYNLYRFNITFYMTPVTPHDKNAYKKEGTGYGKGTYVPFFEVECVFTLQEMTVSDNDKIYSFFVLRTSSF